MTADDEQLRDPVVLRALRRIGALDDQPELCPGCAHRELADGESLCPSCKAQQRKQSRNDWWSRQGDYEDLRRRHGAREGAARWVAHELRKGPVAASTIRADAARAGIARKTLRRAREQLQETGRLVVERSGLARGAAQWRLTTLDERRPDAHMGTRSGGTRADSARPSGGLAGPDTDDHHQEHDR